MDQNYRFYKPLKGLVMGSPVSPILAEIFMNDFENRILKGSRSGSMIKHLFSPYGKGRINKWIYS